MAKKQDDQHEEQNGQDQGTDDVAKSMVSIEEFEKLQTDFQTLQEQFDQVNSQFKRALADYHNLEKRVADGRAELATWATSQLLQKLLPSLDYLEMATSGVSEDEKKSGWFKGVEMAVKQLNETLKYEGLEQIEAEGKFDPTLHEAVDTREGEEGKILEVTRKGYSLNGKVLRPALVVVGRK